MDLDTGTVTSFPPLGDELYVFDLALSPDGRIYAGTYPGGKVYEIDPMTGGVHDLGPAEVGLKYVRSVAVGPDGTVYAGTGSAARLVAIDPSTGARRNLLPAELLGESFVYAVAVSRDVVVAGTEPGGKLLVHQLAHPDRQTVVASGERTIDAVAIDGRRAWFTARPSGALYVYDIDTAALTRVGVPCPGQETRGLFVRSGRVQGAAAGGLWWRWPPGSDGVVDLHGAGLREGPEPLQSMSYAGAGRVVVGGNFGLVVHDLNCGTATRRPMTGEAKTMVSVSGKTYMGVYPGAVVQLYDHRTDEIKMVGRIGGRSNRPRDSFYDPHSRLLLLGTRNQYGHTGGALAVVDLESSRIDTYDDIVPDQAIAAVMAHEGVAYLGTEISADGITPTATEAILVAFDLAGRRVDWVWKPLAGAAGYVSLQWHEGLLYGVTTDSRIVVLDVPGRKVRATGMVAQGWPGEFALYAGGLFLVTSEALLQVGADASATAVLECLADEGWGKPLLAVDEKEGYVFTCSNSF
ncbi:hypothetical protein [Nonomuraea sp. NPDC049625]|uniref:hypothetical protein n=1 Tax=Nonomuraea sp. NPDC049625 TaxID=3155775 RepID=UPI003443519B